MKRRKWGCLLAFLIALGGVVLVLAVLFAYSAGPVRMPDLDPAKILGEETSSATLAAVRRSGADAASALAPPAEPNPDRVWSQEDLEVLSRIPEKAGSIRFFLDSFLDLKRREGRDNALIHYALALALAIDSADWEMVRLTRSLSDGSRQDARFDTLRSVSESWEPALAEARIGAALDHAPAFGAALSPFYDSGLETLALALCVNGRYLESRGDPDKALDDYLAALTMGRDACTRGNGFSDHVIGGRIQESALFFIRDLAATGRLDEDTLLRVFDRLGEIDRTSGTAADAFEIEFARRIAWIQADLDALKGASPRQRWDDFLQTLYLINDPHERHAYLFGIRARRNTERIPGDLKAIHDLEQSLLAEPWWGRPREKFEALEKRVASSHVLVRLVCGSWSVWFEHRDEPRLCALRTSRIALALEIRKARNERYPETLDVLAPEFFEAGLPVDPYSGKPFVYRPSPDGAGYSLWSVGPDIEDNDGAIYDPTNGFTSASDVVVGNASR
ncbi:hypothetical protein JW916_10905 [Candidatus Sumerlaeota bacterium]|nr:hypothetical protein [Candidatus Sumerlaeota bacterium]